MTQFTILLKKRIFDERRMLFIKYMDENDEMMNDFFTYKGESFLVDGDGYINLFSNIRDKEIKIDTNKLQTFKYDEDDYLSIEKTEDWMNFHFISDKFPIIKTLYDKIIKANTKFENIDVYFFKERFNLSALYLSCCLKSDTIIDIRYDNEENIALLKKIWSDEIELQKKEVLGIFEKLIENTEDKEEKESIIEVRDILKTYNSSDDLDKMKTFREIFLFWPTILLPAPTMVNIALAAISMYTECAYIE